MQTISSPDSDKIHYIAKIGENGREAIPPSKRMRPPRCRKHCLALALQGAKSHKGVGGKGRYELGYRYCAKCAVYFLPQYLDDGGLYCRCCKMRTRTKPNNSQTNKKHRELVYPMTRRY